MLVVMLSTIIIADYDFVVVDVAYVVTYVFVIVYVAFGYDIFGVDNVAVLMFCYV